MTYNKNTFTINQQEKLERRGKYMNNALKKTIVTLLIAIMVITTLNNHTAYGASKGPKGIKATQLTNQYKVKVTWKKVKNAGKYELYKRYNKKWKKIKILKKNSYTDKNVKPGRTYKYRVRAVLKNKKKSKYSKTVKVKIKRKTNTGKPDNKPDNNKNNTPSKDDGSSNDSKDNDVYEEPENPIYVGFSPEKQTAYFSNNVEDLIKAGVDVNDKDCYCGEISRKVFDNVSPLYYCQKNHKVVYVIDFINEIKPVNTRSWFNKLYHVSEIKNMDNLNTSNVTDMSCMFMDFGQFILRKLKLGNKFDTSKVENMDNMFDKCGTKQLSELDLGDKFDTSNVKDLSGIFAGCGEEKLKYLDLGDKFDTSGATNMAFMFSDLKAIEKIDWGDKFDTSNATTTKGMFQRYGYYSLKHFKVPGNFDTSNVTDMTCMFQECGYNEMMDLDLGDKFDTSKVQCMFFMFDRCGYMKLEELDLGNKFDTRVVNDAMYMFRSCGHESLKSLNLGRKFATQWDGRGRHMFDDLPNIKNIDFGIFDVRAEVYSENQSLLGLTGINKNMDSCTVYSKEMRDYLIEVMNWNVKNWTIIQDEQ